MGNAARNLDAALNLVAVGLFVFPAGVSQHTGSEKWVKKPLIGGWQSKATTDPAQIRQWWLAYPHALPGIELGRSGLVALDGDRHGGPDGVAALNETLGADTPRHPISLTAGGGEHHIFRQLTNTEPVGNGTGQLPKGIDVRGHGGWIVAPGSVRPDGKLWLADPDAPSLSEAFSSATIPLLPEHIVDLIRTSPSSVAEATPPVLPISERAMAQIERPTGRLLSYGDGLLKGVCREISSAPVGARNSILNAGSFRAGRAVASGALDREMADKALLRAAHDSGLVAEDGEPAARATIRSGLNAGVLRPLGPLTDRTQPNLIAAGQSALRQTTVLHWHENDNEFAMPSWLVKHMLPEIGVALLSGQSMSGKTFVALNLAHCVATGKQFANHKIKRKGGTLFMAAEAAGNLRTRLRGIAAPPLSGKHDALPFTWVEVVPSLSQPNALDKIIAIAVDAAAGMHEKFGLPLVLIVIDTMAAAAGFEDENDAAQAQVVMNVLQGLARETGALVMAVDHFGKNRAGSTRGSSAKEASADAVLVIDAPTTDQGVVQSRALSIRKLRDGPTGEQIKFTLEKVGFGFDEDGDEITTRVVQFSTTAVAALVNEDRWSKLKDFKRALEVALIENRRDIRPFGMELSPVVAAPLHAVRDEFNKAYSGEVDARRKSWGRKIKKARDLELVCTRELGGKVFIWMVDAAVSAPTSIIPTVAA